MSKAEPTSDCPLCGNARYKVVLVKHKSNHEGFRCAVAERKRVEARDAV